MTDTEKKENKSKRAKKYYLKNKDKCLEYAKRYREDNAEKKKEYNKKNKEKLIEGKRIYRENNKEKLKEKAKEYRKNNKEKFKKYRKDNKEELKEKRKIHYINNKEKCNEQCNKYQKNRKQTEPLFKLRCNITNLIRGSIRNKGYTKKSKSFEILGCTFEEFKKHIERQFIAGMNWHNRNEWHLDHIYPTSLAKSEQELIKLNHYTNFQPMWALENISKGNKIIANTQIKLI